MTSLALNAEDRRHLRGESFSSAYTFSTEATPFSSRVPLLAQMVSGRSVLHVGFADHIELIEAKRRSGHWLHDQLVASASLCVGVDTNEEAVESLRRNGVSDVYAADVTHLSDDHPVAVQRFDCLVLGEVVEHIANPEAFLRDVVSSVGRPGASVVVTVPNAWGLSILRAVLRSRELVNSDHRFWFTPFTIAKVLTDAGLAVDTVLTTEYSSGGRSVGARLHRMVVGRFGLVRACVVASATIPDD